MKAPIPYAPALETPEPDEAQTTRDLDAAFEEIRETVLADEGRARRSVHAKGHGTLTGRLTVLGNLAPEYAQGLFATPGVHDAILRFSTNPGDILDDSISLPRGAALKVMGVEGVRLPGAEGATQDFVMVNGPAFSATSAKQFLGSLKFLAKTTDRAEWAKKALSAVFRTVERGVEAVGGESATLKTLGGAKNVHPLGETYFSQTAFRHGAYVAKYSLLPVSPSLTALTGTEIAIGGRPDAIREEMDRAAQRAPMAWELRVQLCRDPETMPIEDPTVPWDESDSPFVAVARLEVEPQAAWKGDAPDDALRFSPWTGLVAHRPLGAINRVRRDTYEVSARFREQANACPIHEPATAELSGG